MRTISIRCISFLTIILITLCSKAQTSGDFDIPDASGILPPQEKAIFDKQKVQLTADLKALQELTKEFNKTCVGKQIPEDNVKLIEQCKTMSANVDNDETILKDKIRKYKKDLSDAEALAKIKKSMVDLARKFNWTEEEIKRLDSALNKLGTDGDLTVEKSQIISSWTDIRLRGEDPGLKIKANGGTGPGLPGAGKQSTNDCAVFALANVTGRPYSEVAAIAIDLIQKGEWRSEEDKKDPQKVFTNGGLMGGEVLMLTEALGQVEVIKSSEFEKTLSSGRNIMVNVVPYDGNMNSGHEVVLTKTFKQNGETWFEMIDSNREGPWQRRYLSAKELQIILKENGVVYRPEKGTVPKLLR